MKKLLLFLVGVACAITLYAQSYPQRMKMADRLDPTNDGVTCIAGASEVHIGQVGGHSVEIVPTITTTSSAYTANDVVGTDVAMTGAVRVNGGTAILQDIVVLDDFNQKAALTILFYNANPAGTYTDNGALPDQSADLATIIARVNVSAGDYETVNGSAVASISGIGKVLKSAATTSIWVVVVTTGTPTYGANSTSLSIKYHLFQD